MRRLIAETQMPGEVVRAEAEETPPSVRSRPRAHRAGRLIIVPTVAGEHSSPDGRFARDAMDDLNLQVRLLLETAGRIMTSGFTLIFVATSAAASEYGAGLTISLISGISAGRRQPMTEHQVELITTARRAWRFSRRKRQQLLRQRPAPSPRWARAGQTSCNGGSKTDGRRITPGALKVPVKSSR